VWRVAAIAGTIAGTSGNPTAAEAFLAPQESAVGSAQQPDSSQRDNMFRFPPEAPKLEVRVGSIHSVKGETHAATLVLDTFFYNHHLATLKAWLVGEKSGGASENSRTISRLRQHYVAMTRPSHLLCLAMRENCLSNDDVASLEERGWRLARVMANGTVWL
jgi:hypothetical protein